MTISQGQLNVTSKCPYGKCDGSGMVWEIVDGMTMAGPCKCYGEQIAQSKIAFAEIPEEFRGLTINSFDTEVYGTYDAKLKARAAKKLCANYVKNFKLMQEKAKGLYMYGYAKGSGKTRMAVSIGNALINLYKVSVKFTTTINLIKEIQGTFDRDKQSEYTQSQLLDAVKRVDVLILDDIGTEQPTAWVRETFFSILNDRMTANKITIFTSNGTVKELKHDERIKNRIEKMAMPVWFPDESIRSKLAQQENEELEQLLLE